MENDEKEKMVGQTSPRKPDPDSPIIPSRRLRLISQDTEKIKLTLSKHGLEGFDKTTLEGLMRGAIQWPVVQSRLNETELLQMVSSVWIDILANPKDLTEQLEKRGWKPRSYRGHSFNGRDGLEISGEVDSLPEVTSMEFSQLFQRYARNIISDNDSSQTIKDILGLLDKIYVKSMPGQSGRSRVIKEYHRIKLYEEFNESALMSGLTQQFVDNPEHDFINVPLLFTKPKSIDRRTYLAMERIPDDRNRLYEELKAMDEGKQGEDYRQTTRQFWEHTIDRIVRSQVASLSLPSKYIDEVQAWDPNSRDPEVNKREAVRQNREFYINQLLKKFVGNEEGMEETGFPGALHISLNVDLDKKAKRLVKKIYGLIEEYYEPIAHILAELPPGIDCDRSLWNIFDQTMVDFETVTNSPHPIALANTTAQGIYFHNLKEYAEKNYAFKEPGKPVPTVAIPQGSRYTVRDFLRFRYVSRFNEILTDAYQRGCFGKTFNLEQHLIKDWKRFKLGHAAAGVQRSLVHYATFLKTMRNVEQDVVDLKSLIDYASINFEQQEHRKLEEVLGYKLQGLEHEYHLAHKGMEGCLTQARDHLKEVDYLLQQPGYFDKTRFDFDPEAYPEYAKKLFTHPGLYGSLKILRKYLRDKKSTVRSRLLNKSWDDISIITE